MPRKRTRLSHKKERCLLSDVLPYEIPISFSNRNFYKFILENRISIEQTSIVWQKSSPALDSIVHLMFALPLNRHRLTDEQRPVGTQRLDFRCYRLDGGANPKPMSFMKPFAYKIRHKQNEFRELCVPHPRSQLNIVNFYDRCKETILYYTSLSSFSIRAPSRISKYRYHKDSLHYARLAKDSSIVEETGREYENLKSFFVYKQYSNIYKFYESYKFHRSEKKYNKLIKLDISKCFDSIYTHSIGWAILGKETQKEALFESIGTFPDRFDALMRHMNFGETNGIIIGPEFSRIFAEIILQSVDREVEHILRNSEKGLINKIDYEIFRYVDDYFIFYNKKSDKNTIVDQLQHSLRNYKLYLNSSKAVLYKKPIITEITMAKKEISRLLANEIGFNIEKVSEDNDDKKLQKGSIFVNSNSLITEFKAILKKCGVTYMDILNYTLSIVEHQCEKVFKNFNKLTAECRSEPELIQAVIGILEFVFFIYSVSPRVNTTIRLCRITQSIISFFKSNASSPRQVELVKKQIYDNICFILKKNGSEKQTQVETLYLLVALSELGREYWLEQNVLADYLGVSIDNDHSRSIPANSLNYFSITVALFYMKDKVRYNSLRDHIVKAALENFRKRSITCHREAELVFLLFDLISCPYIDDNNKLKACNLFGISNNSLASNIIQYTGVQGKPQLWFTNWMNFDFGKELDAKRSQEVY